MTPATPRPARRLLVVTVTGALISLAGWVTFGLVRDFLPVWLRLVVGAAVLVFGAGAGLTCQLLAPLPLLARVVLAFSFGVAFAPVIAHVLGTFGLVAVYPYLAAALMGGAIAFWYATRPAPLSVRPRTLGAAAVLVLLTACVGAAAFANRMTTTRGSTVLHGDYDTYDLTYYAAIEAELTHTVPPASPFFAGRLLNHSFYPHVVLALLHRFGAVPTLDLYFRYAWPAFLMLAVLGCFVFVESISTTRAAFFSAILFGFGSDLSYMAGWFFQRSDWDDVIWSQNFQGGGAEVLLYNNWTPALVVLFGGLYALHASCSPSRSTWAAVAGASFAVTILSKPWIFAAVLASLCVTIVVSWRDERVRRRLLVAAGVSIAVAVPFVYRAVTLSEDAQVTFAPAFFPIPLVMVGRLGLREWFLDVARMLGGTGSAQVSVAAVLATPLFLLGSLGYRLTGLAELWRCIRRPLQRDPIWRVLAWTVVAAFVASTFIVSVPYHENTQIHQFTLFLLALFVGQAVGAWRATGAGLSAAAVVIAIAVPSTLRYVHLKWSDQATAVAEVTARERPLVALLQETDPDRTVLLHDRPNDPTLLGILAERRSVLSWGDYVRGDDGRRNSGAGRRNDVEFFFASADAPAEKALDVLRTYRPTHVVEYRQRDRINVEVRDRLEFVFSNQDVALYRVPERLWEAAPQGRARGQTDPLSD